MHATSGPRASRASTCSAARRRAPSTCATDSRIWRRSRSPPGAGSTRWVAGSSIRPAEGPERLAPPASLPETREQRLELLHRELLALLGGEAPFAEILSGAFVFRAQRLV